LIGIHALLAGIATLSASGIRILEPATSDLFQGELKVEDLARLNGALQDQIHQFWKITT
jgi:hypothetical protein